MILRLALLAMFCVGASGCAKMGSWRGLPGFADSDKSKPKVKSPRERMDDLQALGKRARRMSPPEQESVSQELAQAIAKEQDTLVRAQILMTMAHFPTDTAARILEAGLVDADTDVRVAACQALGQRGGERSVDQLARVLSSDTSLDVRLAAARALGATGDSRAVSALGVALQDSDPSIQRRAVASLENVTDRDFETVGEWREYIAGRDPRPQSESIVQRIVDWF